MLWTEMKSIIQNQKSTLNSKTLCFEIYYLNMNVCIIDEWERNNTETN